MTAELIDFVARLAARGQVPKPPPGYRRGDYVRHRISGAGGIILHDPRPTILATGHRTFKIVVQIGTLCRVYVLEELESAVPGTPAPVALSP